MGKGASWELCRQKGTHPTASCSLSMTPNSSEHSLPSQQGVPAAKRAQLLPGRCHGREAFKQPHKCTPLIPLHQALSCPLTSQTSQWPFVLLSPLQLHPPLHPAFNSFNCPPRPAPSPASDTLFLLPTAPLAAGSWACPAQSSVQPPEQPGPPASSPSLLPELLTQHLSPPIAHKLRGGGSRISPVAVNPVQTVPARGPRLSVPQDTATVHRADREVEAAWPRTSRAGG